MSARIRVGIGGWVYEPWQETFYPQKLAKTKQLEYASRQLGAIEINATFYRTQSASTFRKWADETPDDFVFSLKANRFSVSRKDLAEGVGSSEKFFASGLTELGAKLGPILWQLAATKKFDAGEIEAFCAALPRERDGVRLRHVLEVRHASFVVPELVAIARRHGVAICLALSDDYPLIADPTADFCYLRLQTTRADVETGYDAATVATWALVPTYAHPIVRQRELRDDDDEQYRREGEEEETRTFPLLDCCSSWLELDFSSSFLLSGIKSTSYIRSFVIVFSIIYTYSLWSEVLSRVIACVPVGSTCQGKSEA